MGRKILGTDLKRSCLAGTVPGFFGRQDAGGTASGTLALHTADALEEDETEQFPTFSLGKEKVAKSHANSATFSITVYYPVFRGLMDTKCGMARSATLTFLHT